MSNFIPWPFSESTGMRWFQELFSDSFYYTFLPKRLTHDDYLYSILNMKIMTKVERIDTMEMAGTVLLDMGENTEETYACAFRYLRHSLTLRSLDLPMIGESIEDWSPICKTPLKSKNGKLIEWSTLDDLVLLETLPAHQREIQSLLTRLRILSGFCWNAVHLFVFERILHFLQRGLRCPISQMLDFISITLETFISSERPHESTLQADLIRIVSELITIFERLPLDDPNFNSENLQSFVELVLMMDATELEASIAENLSRMMKILSRYLKLITEETRLALLQLVHRDGRNPSGCHLLLIACRRPDCETLSAVRFLIKLGANPNSGNNVGDGVLHILSVQPASETRDATARYLLKNGAHLDMVNKAGMTAADLWLEKNNQRRHDLPDWLHEGVSSLKCLSSRVIRRHKLPYDDGAILPAVLIPFVTLH